MHQRSRLALPHQAHILPRRVSHARLTRLARVFALADTTLVLQGLAARIQ